MPRVASDRTVSASRAPRCVKRPRRARPSRRAPRPAHNSRFDDLDRRAPPARTAWPACPGARSRSHQSPSLPPVHCCPSFPFESRHAPPRPLEPPSHKGSRRRRRRRRHHQCTRDIVCIYCPPPSLIWARAAQPDSSTPNDDNHSQSGGSSAQSYSALSASPPSRHVARPGAPSAPQHRHHLD